jgi:hypothetical protein
MAIGMRRFEGRVREASTRILSRKFPFRTVRPPKRGPLDRQLAQIRACVVRTGRNALNAVHQSVYIERLANHGLN